MRFRTRLAALASIPALALGVGLTATAASASTANVSFSSTAGNSAHWNGNHTALVFDINRVSAPKGQGGYGYAIAYLHSTTSGLPPEKPIFTATGYATGTPRMVIFFSDGGYLFVYPNGTYQGHGNGLEGLYTSDWSQVSAAASNKTVDQVYIVADASQTVPYTATVTALQYGSLDYVG